MLRVRSLSVLYLAVIVAGCENPADDKFKATASAPKSVTEASPAPSADSASPSGGAPAPSAGTLVIAPDRSTIGFTGSKVTGKHEGGFKTFSGTAERAADKPEVRAIHVTIDMNSLWSDNEKLTGHLKSPDFFDVARFPQSTFVTTEIKPGGEKGASHTVTGNLTLHGVTKSISFPATIKTDDSGMTLTSEFAINRKDFNIKTPGKPDDLIRDEVVIRLDVKAAKGS